MGEHVSRRHFLRTIRNGLLVALPLASIIPARAVFEGAHGDAWMEQAHMIGLALFSCATDNALTYPDGKSSTEIFQKLIDGHYVSDPSVFYLPLAGKTKATSAQLKPENVGFDFSGGITGDSPDVLPVVYSTGYKVSYTDGGPAVPIVKPPPLGMAIVYKSNASKFIRGGMDGSVANFLPTGFNGTTYRQLTPDGVVPA